MIDRAIAYQWLGRGLKYDVSRFMSNVFGRGEWDLPISAVLAKFNLKLNGKAGLEETIYTLRGRFSWNWDPLHGLADFVTPPIRTLSAKSGDCDDAAMVHCQVIDHALGPLGWRGRIVSYLAGPDWALSHHFAIGVDPEGQCWPVQPPPATWQSQDLDYVWGHACADPEQAAREVAATYGEVWPVGFDVRSGSWSIVEKWHWLA